MIWGTDVVVSLCKAKFRKFINQYLPTDGENISENMNVTEPYYLQELQQVFHYYFHLVFAQNNTSLSNRLPTWKIHS